MGVASHPRWYKSDFRVLSNGSNSLPDRFGEGKVPWLSFGQPYVKRFGFFKQVTHDLASLCVDKMVHSGSLLMNHGLYFFHEVYRCTSRDFAYQVLEDICS